VNSRRFFMIWALSMAIALGQTCTATEAAGQTGKEYHSNGMTAGQAEALQVKPKR